MNIIKKLIGKIFGIWCGKCGNKLTPQGYYRERSYCKGCK